MRRVNGPPLISTASPPTASPLCDCVVSRPGVAGSEWLAIYDATGAVWGTFHCLSGDATQELYDGLLALCRARKGRLTLG